MNELIHMPLVVAHLCQDCSEVSNSDKRCLACASVNVYPLANIVDRKPVAAEGAARMERRA